MDIKSKDRNLMLTLVLLALVAVFFVGTVLKTAAVDEKIAEYTSKYETLETAAAEKQAAVDVLSAQHAQAEQQWKPYVILYEKWVGWNEEILQYINR